MTSHQIIWISAVMAFYSVCVVNLARPLFHGLSGLFAAPSILQQRTWQALMRIGFSYFGIVVVYMVSGPIVAAVTEGHLLEDAQVQNHLNNFTVYGALVAVLVRTLRRVNFESIVKALFYQTVFTSTAFFVFFPLRIDIFHMILGNLKILVYTGLLWNIFLVVIAAIIVTEITVLIWQPVWVSRETV